MASAAQYNILNKKSLVSANSEYKNTNNEVKTINNTLKFSTSNKTDIDKYIDAQNITEQLKNDCNITVKICNVSVDEIRNNEGDIDYGDIIQFYSNDNSFLYGVFHGFDKNRVFLFMGQEQLTETSMDLKTFMGLYTGIKLVPQTKDLSEFVLLKIQEIQMKPAIIEAEKKLEEKKKEENKKKITTIAQISASGVGNILSTVGMVLLIIPEPTMTTKVVGSVLLVVGIVLSTMSSFFPFFFK